MPRDVATEDVRRLQAAGAQIVEVLPKAEYDEEHLPAAVHVPLRKLEELAPERLDPARPVVVYCWDYQ
jgi:rhodanese-related sulfurtransferase